MSTELNSQAADLMEKLADEWESGVIGWNQWNISRYNTHTGLKEYCLVGGLTRPTGDTHQVIGTREYAITMLRRKINHGLMTWNDMPERTKEQVIDLLKETAKDLRNRVSAT